tara:strand:+ start:1236 stop:3455 length:2220 start_codon:yes stop_codon:yes gene_type:complete
MPNEKYSKLTDSEVVQKVQDMFRTYSKNRETWARHAQEDKEFRLGKQWTSEQKDILESRGQAPIVVNRIHPAVEAAKAMITSNRPSFRVAAREDSDNKVAQTLSHLLSYMYDISDGRSVIREVVDDYYVTGLGYMHVYQDPMMDMGKGEVCMHSIDPLDVYVDPNSRSRFFDDAENIIISRFFTRDQAKKLYPMYESAIDNAESDRYTDRPVTGRADDGETIFPEDTETKTEYGVFGSNDEYVRGYEWYSKELVEKFRLFETFSGYEDLLSEEEFNEYIQRPAWIIQGQPVVDPQQAEALIAQLQQEAILNYQVMIEEETAKGIPLEDLPEAPEIDIKEIDYQQLVLDGLIDVARVQVKRVHHCVVVGDKKLYSRVLPTEDYPVIPFVNIHTRTPYPVSDVRMVKNMQEYINKTRSLIVAHATTSTNTKILVPEGSVDMKEFEEKWSQPGVAIPVDMDAGAPMPVQPMPLPNELYKNEMDAKNDIDHQLGLYEMMMGNSAVAPQTYKATISLDEFGQRKIKSKLADIEASLTRVAQVAIPLMQQLYTVEKIFRIVQPNNSMSEYAINKRLYDDKSNEVKVINDITVGKYDVVVVAGSTLPTNRYAELEFYMDAYAKGLIDREEVLKKTEVFDIEGVMERTDMIQQLQSQLQQAQEQIKQLSGDLQTRDRESVNLRKRVEVEKFKSDMDKVSNKAQAANTLFEKRLDDNLSTVKTEISRSIANSSPSAGRTEAAKNKENE